MEFIERIIRHIPDRDFKTIRYYGLYSRKNKGKIDKVLKVKKNKISKKNWKEKIEESTGKNPLLCPRCKEEMEYKGTVCFKNGELVIVYAKCKKARRCMEELIGYESTRKKKNGKSKRKRRTEIKKFRNQEVDGQICLFGVQD